MVLAHIAGIPVEETALSFGPVVLLAGGVASARIRERLRDGRRRRPGGRAQGNRGRR
jgi:hypothetical protein